MSERPVIIVGAGIAGLTCAKVLTEQGIPVLVLDAAAAPGGRIQTDEVDGFLLDRGFQVLLTAYPAARKYLDFDALRLRHFRPGATVWTGETFEQISDPWRAPTQALTTLLARVGTLTDKLKIAQLRRRSCRGSLEELFAREEKTALTELQDLGFSGTMIERFFRPFFGGIFLEKELETSSRMLQFVFRMFSTGTAALPQRGMGEIPRQLAACRPPDSLRLKTAVAGVKPGAVELADGTVLDAAQIVLATDQQSAGKLLAREDQEQQQTPARPELPGRTVACVYFSAHKPPVKEPLLVLNGSGQGLVNNLCVPSQVVPEYAPEGKSLISATVVSPPPLSHDQLAAEVQTELTGWFGSAVENWQHLRTYVIREALPNQNSVPLSDHSYSAGRPEKFGIHVCGDHTRHASLQGAMESGEAVAQQILEQAAVRSC